MIHNCGIMGMRFIIHCLAGKVGKGKKQYYHGFLFLPQLETNMDSDHHNTKRMLVDTSGNQRSVRYHLGTQILRGREVARQGKIVWLRKN